MSVKRIWSAQAGILDFVAERLRRCRHKKQRQRASPTLPPDNANQHQRHRDARNSDDSRGSERKLRRRRERQHEHKRHVVGKFGCGRQRNNRHDRLERNVHGAGEPAHTEHDHHHCNQRGRHNEKGNQHGHVAESDSGSYFRFAIPNFDGDVFADADWQRLRAKFHGDVQRTDADDDLCLADGIASLRHRDNVANRHRQHCCEQSRSGRSRIFNCDGRSRFGGTADFAGCGRAISGAIDIWTDAHSCEPGVRPADSMISWRSNSPRRLQRIPRQPRRIQA